MILHQSSEYTKSDLDVVWLFNNKSGIIKKKFTNTPKARQSQQEKPKGTVITVIQMFVRNLKALA